MKTAYRNDVFRREDTTFMGDLIRSVGQKPTAYTRTMPVSPVLGRHTPAPAPIPTIMASSRPVQPRSAQMGDILDDISGQATALLKDLDALIAALPVESAGPFKVRRDACLAMESFAKYKCLYDLYNDIKKALNNTTPNAYPAPVAAPAAIPWMWIGIAGAGALALVAIVSLARK